jgi:hypothetical protein
MRTFLSSRSLASLGFTLALAASAIGIVACSSDDSSPGTGAGGSGGTGGGTGGGGTGGATDGGAGKDASTDGPTDGKAPEAAAEAARDAIVDVVTDCGTPGAIHTVPTVPAAIATPAGVTLLAGYRGSGNQIYTCTPATTDGGTDAAVSGMWVNTAVATLYGDNCAAAVSHTFTAAVPPSPRWAFVEDGSAVVGARIGNVPAPTSDAGDGGAPAIQWLLLRAASTSGEGVFTNVTYIQRVDTVGGVGPAGSCDPASDAGTVVTVPYSATYYFYTGTPIDAGTDAAPAGDGAADAAGEATTSADSGPDAPLADDAEAGDAPTE